MIFSGHIHRLSSEDHLRVCSFFFSFDSFFARTIRLPRRIGVSRFTWPLVPPYPQSLPNAACLSAPFVCSENSNFLFPSLVLSQSLTPPPPQLSGSNEALRSMKMDPLQHRASASGPLGPGGYPHSYEFHTKRKMFDKGPEVCKIPFSLYFVHLFHTSIKYSTLLMVLRLKLIRNRKPVDSGDVPVFPYCSSSAA